MKLNPDCIRDVLIYLEDNLVYELDKTNDVRHLPIPLSTIVDELKDSKKRTVDDIKYSIEKLVEIEYITNCNIIKGKNSTINYSISDITYEGHQFLNTIRPQSVWDATKKCASKLGLSSIHALSSIAMKIVDTVITDPNIINKITSFI